jgi:elongation of very long chain fatty acids protein 6
MERLKPFDLRGPLAAWNLGLALFSFVGFLRTAPHLVHYVATRGVYESVR